ALPTLPRSGRALSTSQIPLPFPPCPCPQPGGAVEKSCWEGTGLLELIVLVARPCRGAGRPERHTMMPDPATWVGRTLDDRWRVLDKLGEGGMAYVFLAEDRLQGMMVVLKAPKPKALQKEELVARFRHEIATLRQLVHPHIVKILDCTEHEG